MRLPAFVFDHPPCPSCGAAMTICGRNPLPALGSDWERVAFECAKCGTLHTRAMSASNADESNNRPVAPST
jgi:predicted RNA-binding Zn-ribbon protein involved in translation (DUF1610 family)